MSSRPSLGYWVLFIVINIVVSALTTWLVVRQLVPSPSVAASVTAPKAAEQATSVSINTTGTPVTTPSTSSPNPSNDTAANPTNATPEATPNTPAEPTTQPASTQVTTTLDNPSSTDANVRITAVIYPGQQSREVIVIVNEGNDINLNGWTINTPRGKVFTFGNLTLYKDSFINVHTTNGGNTATDLFWNQTEPVWQSGDNVELKNNTATVATYTVK